MKNNTIIINNKEFILPDSVLLIFNEYLDKYFREKRLNELSNLKKSLMDEYKETSAIHFKKKKELKKKISDLTTEMMKVGVANSKIEIPDWQTIEDLPLKYQFLSKLTNMVCDIIGEFVQESDEQIVKLYRNYIQEINTNINVSKIYVKKDNYNMALKRLYRTLEINLTINDLMKEFEKNPMVNIDAYAERLNLETDKKIREPNIENTKGKKSSL